MAQGRALHPHESRICLREGEGKREEEEEEEERITLSAKEFRCTRSQFISAPKVHIDRARRGFSLFSHAAPTIASESARNLAERSLLTTSRGEANQRKGKASVENRPRKIPKPERGETIRRVSSRGRHSLRQNSRVLLVRGPAARTRRTPARFEEKLAISFPSPLRRVPFPAAPLPPFPLPSAVSGTAFRNLLKQTFPEIHIRLPRPSFPPSCARSSFSACLSSSPGNAVRLTFLRRNLTT